MKRKRCHAQGHQQHHAILVQRIAFPKDGEMEEHDGQEFARFGEDEGKIVDVPETGIPERRRQ